MVLTTKIAIAKAGTKSIKSTVPEGIVEFLQLEDKDELEWEMDIQNNDRIVIVKKRKLNVNPKHVKPERVKKNA